MKDTDTQWPNGQAPLPPPGQPQKPPPQPAFGKLGRKAVRHDSRTLKLARYLTAALPKPPAALDWSQGQQTGWDMLLNDTLGDCTIAAVGHAVQTWSRQVMTEAAVTDQDVLAAYEVWDGYDPSNPATDQGGILLDVLNNWRASGFAGHTLNAYAEVNVDAVLEVKQAINLFGGVYIGVDLPKTAQSQAVWDVDLSKGKNSDAGTWGGHCVWVPAYDEDGFTCITWGGLKRMTTAFWQAYCDEAYALLGTDWLNPGGQAPSGFNSAQLTADLQAIV